MSDIIHIFLIHFLPIGHVWCGGYWPGYRKSNLHLILFLRQFSIHQKDDLFKTIVKVDQISKCKVLSNDKPLLSYKYNILVLLTEAW